MMSLCNGFIDLPNSVKTNGPLSRYPSYTGCRKKYGTANYQYFMNGAIYQCNILRHGK